MYLISAFAADITPLMNDEFYRHIFGLVSEERRQKADRYRFPKDRCLCIGAEYLLMKVFSEMETGLSMPALTTDVNGKPDFSAGPFHFSLSHSGNTAFCVISDCPVGCDVEEIRPFDTRVADRFFAEDEKRILNETPEGDGRLASFFRLWTLKESYVKCTGRGLKTPFRDFSIDSRSAHPHLKTGQEAGLYELGDAVSNGYQFAWCLRKQREDDDLPQCDIRWLRFE